VRHLGRHVDGEVLLVEKVEELGEGLPAPADPGAERRSRDVLDPFHQADEPVAPLRHRGREPDAAVPHDDGGDAVPGRRGERRVPRDLPVVVGVDVDEARGDETARGVERLGAVVVDTPDDADPAVVDRHVPGPGRRAGPVDDGAAADHEVVHPAPCESWTGPSARS
jgi:hypothetical protein